MSKPSPRKVVPTRQRQRKRVRNHIATPAERLRATVFVIRDGAKTKPANCLIGDTPSDTISKCKQIIHWIAVGGKPSGIAIADSNVLCAVVDALEHAKAEASSLWDAAEGMATSMPGVRRG